MNSTTPAVAPNRFKWSIPETYKGIRMRSRLEVRYAKFFDQHRLNWSYEPEGFQIIGVRYLPDFYLPDIRTIVEVKGVLDQLDIRKLSALVPVAAKNDIMTVLAIPGEPVRFQLCHPTPEMDRIAQTDPDWAFVCEWAFDPESDISDDAAFVRCASCGSWFFMDSSMAWTCMACGAGGECFDLVHPGTLGWACHDCPECGERGM